MINKKSILEQLIEGSFRSSVKADEYYYEDGSPGCDPESEVCYTEDGEPVDDYSAYEACLSITALDNGKHTASFSLGEYPTAEEARAAFRAVVKAVLVAKKAKANKSAK